MLRSESVGNLSPSIFYFISQFFLVLKCFRYSEPIRFCCSRKMLATTSVASSIPWNDVLYSNWCPIFTIVLLITRIIIVIIHRKMYARPAIVIIFLTVRDWTCFKKIYDFQIKFVIDYLMFEGVEVNYKTLKKRNQLISSASLCSLNESIYKFWQQSRYYTSSCQTLWFIQSFTQTSLSHWK